MENKLNELESEYSFLERLGIYFLIFIFISGVFEIGLLVYGYNNADKVECNLLWCTFTTERSSLSHYMTSSSECYVNRIKINCSDFPEYFYNNSKFEMNGVCPSPNSNMTIEDCIKEVNND